MERKKLVLGIQHLFAMFGATVLVPTLTGMNAGVALIGAGVGTLLFHFVTGGKVPVFLGSSFAFIGAILAAKEVGGIPAAQGGIIVAGFIYLILSVLAKVVGPEKIKDFFPPVVTGPVVMVIGLSLAPVAINWAKENWWISITVIVVIVGMSIFARGFFKLVPILIGLVVGYILSLVLTLTGVFPDLMDLKSIAGAPIINPIWKWDGTFFSAPVFNMTAILMVAPVAFVTFMEHIGDITTNGTVVKKDFMKDPGLHRTLLGDGIATIFAGLIGAPANTTYSENTGVLAVTKNYDPSILRIAAVYAIFIGCIGYFTAIFGAIPFPVMGGMSIILFGMISAIGIRTLSEANLDFSHSRNLLIVALILVLGLGTSGTGLVIGGVSISGTFIAVVVGVAANKILPKEI